MSWRGGDLATSLTRTRHRHSLSLPHINYRYLRESSPRPYHMAAVASSKMPSQASLATPVTGTYPSELRSPAVGTPTYIKREEPMRTPITPPLAYLDFLKAQSPVTSRPPHSASSTRQPSTEEKKRPAPLTVAELTNQDDDSRVPTRSPVDTRKQTCPPPPPPLSRFLSSDSTTSQASTATTGTTASTNTSSQGSEAGSSVPASTASTVPSSTSADSTSALTSYPLPSPLPYAMQPLSARTPRSAHLRMQIPPSPYGNNCRSPMSAGGPRSAISMHSPYGALSPHSALVTSAMSPYATASPKDWEARDGASGSNRVSVRQVVTRTITYSRTPLDPAPKGKRRKMERDADTTITQPLPSQLPLQQSQPQPQAQQ